MKTCKVTLTENELVLLLAVLSRVRGRSPGKIDFVNKLLDHFRAEGFDPEQLAKDNITKETQNHTLTLLI